MNIRSIKLKEWWWAGYPFLVVGFIFFTFNLAANNSQMISDLSGRQKEAQEAQVKVERLKSKLKSLQEVNKTRETERLAKILVTIPASRKVWILVNEIIQTASQAGAIVKDYRGVVGEIKEASESALIEPEETGDTKIMSMKVQYDFGPFEMIYGVLAGLESQIPLVKINQVTFKETSTEIVLQGAWETWSKLTKDAESPIPDYQDITKRAEADLEKLTGAAGI